MELFIWYGISLLIIGILLFISLKFKLKKESYFIMTGFAIVSELTKALTHVEPYMNSSGKLVGYYMTPAALPFHLCSLLIFVYFYIVLTKDETKRTRVLEFVAPIGLIGGVCGIAFATSGTSFTDPSAYQSFIYHAAVTWFSLHLMISKEVSIGIKPFLRNLVILFGLTICGLWVNSALKAHVITEGRSINFMFLARPPMSGLPILNLDNGWLPYFISLCTLGIVLTFLITLPYFIKELKEKKNK